MTLDVENLQSSVHHKSQVSTPLQYARDFGSAAKERLKRRLAGQRIITQIVALGTLLYRSKLFIVP